MYTYQDFEEDGKDDPKIIYGVIEKHKGSEAYLMALDADEYDAQRNVTINKFVHKLYGLDGIPVEDFTASNNKICSNFYNRLNTQRVMYSLGNGVTFIQPDETGEDTTKEMLGSNFDFDILRAGKYALEHGVTFLYWNIDRMHVFPITEFVPLWDEHDGRLRAGIRFWQVDKNHRMTVEVYEEDGVTVYRSKKAGSSELEIVRDKTPYVTVVSYSDASPEFAVVGEHNYGTLPIVPYFGSTSHRSTLEGMQAAIDAYDLIRSGYANDLTDCAQIYWMVSNAGGMDDRDLQQFRDRLKLTHIATVDTDSGSGAQPYTQEPPYQARSTFLNEIRSDIYEGFGALDVHTVSAGATNDHIDAAYQPLDENAAEFEHWTSEAIHQLLMLQGIDDTPVFKRNRISNQLEQVQMVIAEAQWLDDKTVLRKLPNITPEEAIAILEGNELGSAGNFGFGD